MLFIVIILVFILIGLISFFGDYEAEEKRKDYKKYEEVIRGEFKDRSRTFLDTFR